MKAYRYDGRRIAPNHAPATNHAFQIDGVRRCAELIDSRGRPVQSDDQPVGRC